MHTLVCVCVCVYVYMHMCINHLDTCCYHGDLWGEEIRELWKELWERILLFTLLFRTSQIWYPVHIHVTFFRWLNDEESACQCRRHRIRGFDPWFGKMPWRRKWQPTPVFLPGESHGQRSLAGYSSWGRKEPDTTEHAWMHAHIHTNPLKENNTFIYSKNMYGGKGLIIIRVCY